MTNHLRLLCHVQSCWAAQCMFDYTTLYGFALMCVFVPTFDFYIPQLRVSGITRQPCCYICISHWSAESISPDKNRSLTADNKKGLSRTKSFAPTAKNLVKWSAPTNPAAASFKHLPHKRVSKDSLLSESPRSSATGALTFAADHV